MNTFTSRRIALSLFAGLIASSAMADVTKHPGFIGNVKQAQLAHVDTIGTHLRREHDRETTQTFGAEGGVLDAIWRTHYAAFNNLDATGLDRNQARAMPSTPHSFLLEVKRIHLSASDA